MGDTNTLAPVLTPTSVMKIVIFAALAVLAAAAPAPDKSYSPPEPARYSDESYEFIEILKDDRHHGEDGSYNFDVETANGIVQAESGSPSGPEGAVVMAGQYSYTSPEGIPVVLSYVADENGFQPHSDLLPVSPEFPHPIPDFVLEQIRFAAEEDTARARSGGYDDDDHDDGPSGSYRAP